MGSVQQLHILVVDRDDATCVQLKDFLSAEGYVVTTLGDPSQAPEQVRGGRFQLVVLDVSPTQVGNIESLATIRAVDSDLCIIAMTSVPTVEMAVATMKHQAFHYLQKPIEVDELKLVIDQAIREKGLLVDLETHLNTEVGRRIRAKRQEAQLTLKQLANRTGLSVSLISQIELGKSAASMSTIHKLATALSIPMTYFFETL